MAQLNTSNFEDTGYSNTMVFTNKKGFAVILLDLNGNIVGSLTAIPSVNYESYGAVVK